MLSLNKGIACQKSSVNHETPSSSLTLGCLGDLMIANRVLDALRGIGAESIASRIWAPLEGVDVVLANLEAPITDSRRVRENKRYNLKNSAEILNLFDRRFILGLANNHMLDYGERGLLDTLEALETRNLLHAGAGRNLEEARRPVITNIAGVHLGVICAADPRFQAATKTSPGTFPARPELLKESIQEVRQRSDVIVVSIHAGTEFLSVPSPNQLRLAELCLKEGVRVVSFHHAHRVSGIMEEERGVVFFGTGNYVFPRLIPVKGVHPKESAAWRVILTASGREIEHVEVRPVILDDDGLPAKATESQSRRILSRIQKYSYRIQQKKHLAWWRLWEMISPGYLWLNIVHYFDIGRRQGVRRLLRTVAGGVKAQLYSGS